jgi:hypothetical protein
MNSKAVKGVFYCNQDRTEELNRRIFQRNIPSSQLQQQFSNRPVSTKFTKFQTLSRNDTLNNNEKLIEQPMYNIKNIFNPGTSAPPQGYLNNIDDESKLKRQFFPDQNNYQSKWIPSTTSSLYNSDKLENNSTQPYPRLFTEYNNNNNNNNNNNKLDKYNVGKDMWQNSTRQQLKNIK